MKLKTKGMEPLEALKKITDAVEAPGGYYCWTILSDPAVWLLRAPQANPENETWMKDEKIELIHVCHPVDFYAAMIAEEKDQLALHSGYVKEGSCTRCTRETPEDVVKKAMVQRQLYEVARKTR
jgi:hypothetical protein